MHSYGGAAKKCFSNETKTRAFIDVILKHNVSKHNNFSGQLVVYLDSEVEVIELDEKIRPDYLIMRSNTNKDTDGILDMPLFVVEAKKGSHPNLKIDMHQNFKQLRNICIQYVLPFCNGIFTNGLSWYFTRYSMSRDLKPVEGERVFQQSGEYKVVTDQKCEGGFDSEYKINEEKLAEVVKIIEMLTVFCSTA